MFKKIKVFLLFIILNFIFIYIFSHTFKKYNYTTILFQVDVNKEEIDSGLDTIDKQMEHIIKLIGAERKKSDFTIFSNIQKWHIHDNIFLYEDIQENNKINIQNLLDTKFDLQKKNNLIYQYFLSKECNLNKNLNIIETEFNSFLNLRKQKCVNANNEFLLIRG